MTFAFSFHLWAGPSSYGRGLVTQPCRDQPLRCESSRIPLLAPHLVAVTPCSTRGLLPLISPVKHGAPEDPARGPLRLCCLSAICRRGGSAERTEGHWEGGCWCCCVRESDAALFLRPLRTANLYVHIRGDCKRYGCLFWKTGPQEIYAPIFPEHSRPALPLPHARSAAHVSILMKQRVRSRPFTRRCAHTKGIPFMSIMKTAAGSFI